MIMGNNFAVSGNPFQYMWPTGGLDDGPRWTRTGAKNDNFIIADQGGAAYSRTTSRGIWYKGTQNVSAGQHYPGVVLFGDTRGTVYGGMGIKNGIPSFNTNTSQHYTASTSVIDNNWHHIMFTYDGPTTALKIYIDGVLDYSASVGNIISHVRYDRVCAHYNYNGVAIPTNVCAMVVYDRILSLSEVRQVYLSLIHI